MMQDEYARESIPNNRDGQSKPLIVRRWDLYREREMDGSERQFADPRQDRLSNESNMSRISRVSRRLTDFRFLRKQKPGLESNKCQDKDGTGNASKSSRRFRKRTAFSSIFTRDKEKTPPEEVTEKPGDNLGTTQSLLQSRSSSASNHQALPESEIPDSISKSDKLRSMKESDANRTMFFKSEFPPLSPLSTQATGLICAEGETCNGSRKGEGREFDERGTLNQVPSNEETSEQTCEKQNNDTRGSGLYNTSTSAKVSETVVLEEAFLNTRHASIVVDEGGNVLPLNRPPLPSRRSMHGRSSDAPNQLGNSFLRSRSAPEETHDGTKNAVCNDDLIPWGLKDTDEPGTMAEKRQFSKALRVSGFVTGLKGGRKSVYHSSDGLNESDKETHEGPDIHQPIDMMEDEFVDFSINHVHKKKWHRSNKRKSRRQGPSLA